MPPLGMSSKGRGGLELAEEEEVRDGLSEMSPPWIMKPGMRRWKGVLLYAPLAQRAMKFCVVVSLIHWGMWSEVREGGREGSMYLCCFGDCFAEELDFEVAVGGMELEWSWRWLVVFVWFYGVVMVGMHSLLQT